MSTINTASPVNELRDGFFYILFISFTSLAEPTVILWLGHQHLPQFLTNDAKSKCVAHLFQTVK